MTLLLDAEPTVEDRGPTRRPTRSRLLALDLVAAVFAIAALEVLVVQAGGGRDEGAVTKGLLVLVPAALLARPWNRLPASVIAVAALPALGALLMCLLSPTGWAGADQLATAGYAGLLFVVVAAVGMTERRRAVAVVALAGTGLFQACYGLWVWSAGGDVARPVIGTYYWHNPFAAHVGAAALLLLVIALTSTRGRAACGAGLGSAVCTAAVVLSTSRATTGMLVLLGAVLVLRLLLREPERRRVLGRTLGTAAIAALVVLTLAGPDAVGGGGELGQRTTDETLASSGGHRLDFYRAAVHIVADEPWVGTGAGGYTAAASAYQGPLEARARNVHNGVLQAAVEGGVLLAVAYTLPLLLAAAGLLRRLRRTTSGPDRLLLEAAGAAGALLVLHSLVDFDWTFPALPAVLAALVGLVVSVPLAALPGPDPRRGRTAAGICVLLLLVPFTASLRADAADTAVRSQTLPTRDLALVGVEGPLRDPRFDRLVLTQGDAPEAAVRRAVRRTQEVARLDVTLQWLRAEALVALGDMEAGVALANRTWAPVKDRMPLQAIGYAKVLDRAGRTSEAERVLLDRARYLLALGPAASSRVDGLAASLMSRPTASPAVDCLVRDVIRAVPTSRLLPPSGPRPAGCS